MLIECVQWSDCTSVTQCLLGQMNNNTLYFNETVLKMKLTCMCTVFMFMLSSDACIDLFMVCN